MLLVAMRVLSIKDLKDLSVFGSRGYYRHAGPNGPEEMFLRERSRGTGPRATVDEGVRAVRDQAIPNYGLLLIVLILKILLQILLIFFNLQF